MAYLKEQFDDKSLHLNGLCDLLTKEITELATEEYKLKLVFVLVHIIEESQKALGEIDINNCLKELHELVNKVCEKSEKQQEALVAWFTQDKRVKEVIDGTNDELKTLEQNISELLTQYDKQLKTMIEYRNKLSLPEVLEVKECSTVTPNTKQ